MRYPTSIRENARSIVWVAIGLQSAGTARERMRAPGAESPWGSERAGGGTRTPTGNSPPGPKPGNHHPGWFR